ncbi:CPBP family intramembrane glutamic endopeptidase [Lacticaseibacillus porcinae]|uniref:CPBP family intramembrane glutamic endopeptidase n=1 Tax=Lacticaseibacillus porcinae TaxID=1123687 RepID=UPI000F7766DB|nr:CPBP family intramembrane glutamic endopeptidase [Lacticaseibacillus porcinae]
MSFFIPKTKHFGLKLLGMFIISAVLTIVYIYFLDYLNLGFIVMPLVAEILLGLTIMILSQVWLKLPLFGKVINWKQGTVAMLVMLIVCFTDFGALPEFSNKLLMLALLHGAAAGIFEEALVRGPLLFLVFKHTPKNLSPYWWTAIVTALFFGCMHLQNLSANQDLVQTLIQVGYATALGFGAAALYLFTHNLGFSVLLHGISDCVSYYFAGNSTSYAGDNWLDWVLLALMVCTQLAVGAYLLKQITSTQKV